ncbi:MAG: SpoIIE family protein phosphatase, partial [Planctomycetia bacterium]|nr:SpoIIE family protein phosphatase [Planctomycetia bacterium]
SDGIIEAESAERELFGLPRAVEVVKAHRQRPAQEIVAAMFKAAHDFGRHAPQNDDMTVVVVKVL